MLFFSYKETLKTRIKYKIIVNGYTQNNNILYFKNLTNSEKQNLLFLPLIGHSEFKYFLNLKNIFLKKYFLDYNPSFLNFKFSSFLFSFDFKRKKILLLKRYKTRKKFIKAIGQNIFYSGFALKYFRAKPKYKKYFIVLKLKTLFLTRNKVFNFKTFLHLFFFLTILRKRGVKRLSINRFIKKKCHN